MFDALMFLAGAVLFLFAVLFFIYLWWERNAAIKRRLALAEEQQALKQKKIELEIWQKELQVWHNTLEHEQKQLEQQQQEFRALVTSQNLAASRMLSAPPDSVTNQDVLKADRWGKNLKDGVRAARTVRPDITEK